MRSTSERPFQTANTSRLPTMMEIGRTDGQFPTFAPSRAAYVKRDYVSFAEMPAGELTPRETEVLQLIACGRLNKQAASDLGVSIKTVEKHRQNLMSKLGIHNSVGLTHYAIYFGIVQCDPQLAVA